MAGKIDRNQNDHPYQSDEYGLEDDMSLGRDFTEPEKKALPSAVVPIAKLVKDNRLNSIFDPLQHLLGFNHTETPTSLTLNSLGIVEPSRLSMSKGFEDARLGQLSSIAEQSSDLNPYMGTPATTPVEDTSFDVQPIEFELCRDFIDYIPQSAAPNDFGFDMSIFSNPQEQSSQ